MLKMISGDEMCSSICGKARCIEKAEDNHYSCTNYFPVAQAQLEADLKATENMVEIIEEDFVAIIGNFYMTDDNRRRTYELWGQIKKSIVGRDGKS